MRMAAWRVCSRAFTLDSQGRGYLWYLDNKGLCDVLSQNSQSLSCCEVLPGGRAAVLASMQECLPEDVGAHLTERGVAPMMGMAFGTGCRHNLVERCELVDLGGGGVKIGHAGKRMIPIEAHAAG